ncbi:putative interleukin-17 receptor E-like [Sphaeramia orbicularis]|uniref:Interleukin-17 receptor C/E N-terminal domain-containing protein n=1 Tax=Sphaeramia orbicularis TaxID=375764 RepID=A0A672YL31_9TELE|nr:putative interleukin-17 receptor E-like [Sphaeramia orbicularis]
MILWLTLLVSPCIFSQTSAAAENTRLERIEKCSTRCSQGLNCRTRSMFLLPDPCQNPPEGLNMSSALQSVNLSTVMRCEARQKCSLHLRIQSRLHLNEAIHGLSVCTESIGMIANCQIISFTKASREKMLGQQVVVEHDYTEILPNQELQVTVTPVSSYCSVPWTGSHLAPGCINEDLRRHVPECITGRLSYHVNPERKELSVTVSAMLDDYNYLVRLCHKAHFFCSGTGPVTVIKKEETVKSRTLSYSRPLPCLCIEGWSDVMDARRVQVCPFRHNMEPLWSGIMFDSLEGALSWQPACHVTAVVTLCQKKEGGDVCVDLPNASQNVSREKIKFPAVDPHPQLCMKFTAGSQSWIRCPFTDERFPEWELTVSRQDGVRVMSQIRGAFSVELCVKSTSDTCHTTDTRTVHVGKHKSVALNLPEGLFKDSFCLRVKRMDVKYGATVSHCYDASNQSLPHQPLISTQTAVDWTWVVLPAGVCLAVIIIVTLVLHVMLTVYQRKNQKGKTQDTCPSEKQKGSAPGCIVSVLETRSALHGGVLIPDSPKCGKNEKANLLSH